jgi:1-acyl-sn-glycerol-3-phosphate acyltransferase
LTTEPDRLRLRSRFVWRFALPAIRGTARAAWRLDVDRGPGFPEPPFVLAANHYSFLDPLLVGSVYGSRVRFIALVDLLGHHRSVDWALGSFEVIPVRRGTVPLGTVRESLSHLAGGGVLGLFPEGIRVDRFGDAGFRRGAAWLATRARVPLVAVAVRGTDRVLGVDNKLHRGRIEVVVGPTMLPDGDDRTSIDDLTGRWVDWVASTVSTEAPTRLR